MFPILIQLEMNSLGFLVVVVGRKDKKDNIYFPLL